MRFINIGPIGYLMSVDCPQMMSCLVFLSNLLLGTPPLTIKHLTRLHHHEAERHLGSAAARLLAEPPRIFLSSYHTRANKSGRLPVFRLAYRSISAASVDTAPVISACVGFPSLPLSLSCHTHTHGATRETQAPLAARHTRLNPPSITSSTSR